MATSRSLASFPRLLLRQNNSARTISSTTHLRVDRNPNDQRDAQGDREKMNVEPNEYAKSGTDSGVASNEDAAFDGNTPDPQEAKKQAGKGNPVNPLDASPANPELSGGTNEGNGGSPKPKN